MRNERQNFTENALFEQDETPAHTNRNSRVLLQEVFEGNWTGKHFSVNRLPRSPNLIPPDFYHCGDVQNKVFETTFSNFTQLRRRTTRSVRSIMQYTLDNLRINLESRSDAVIRENRGHIEHLCYYNKNL